MFTSCRASASTLYPAMIWWNCCDRNVTSLKIISENFPRFCDATGNHPWSGFPAYILFSNDSHFDLTLSLAQLHYNDVIMSSMASQITSLTDCSLDLFSRRRSKETSKLRVTGLCEGNSPVTGEFPAQSANNPFDDVIMASGRTVWRYQQIDCTFSVIKLYASASCRTNM